MEFSSSKYELFNFEILLIVDDMDLIPKLFMEYLYFGYLKISDEEFVDITDKLKSLSLLADFIGDMYLPEYIRKLLDINK